MFSRIPEVGRSTWLISERFTLSGSSGCRKAPAASAETTPGRRGGRGITALPVCKIGSGKHIPTTSSITTRNSRTDPTATGRHYQSNMGVEGKSTAWAGPLTASEHSRPGQQSTGSFPPWDLPLAVCLTERNHATTLS